MSQRLDHQIRTLRTLFWSPRDPEGRAFAPLAEAYLEAGDPTQALELVVEGLDRHPDFASGHLVAARVFQATDDLDSALLAFDRVLELDPENTVALLARARISEMKGQLQEAMSRYLRLEALSPGDPQVREAIRKLEAGEVPTADRLDDPSVAVPVDEEAPEEVSQEEESQEDASSPPLTRGVEAAEPSEYVDAPVDAPVPDQDPAPTDQGTSDEFNLEDLDDESQEPEVRTRTMAELLARQGFHDRALEIYRHLLEEAPEDLELQTRVSELAGGGAPDSPAHPQDAESVADGTEVVAAEEDVAGEEEAVPGEEEARAEGAEESGPQVPEFESDFDAGFALDETEVSADYEVIDLEAPEGVDPSEAPVPDGDDDDDDLVAPLAPQWVSHREDALGDQGSPFPWDPDLDEGEEEPASTQEATAEPGTPSSPGDMKGRTAGEYFEDLLAWVPGAVPVESLAPSSPMPTASPVPEVRSPEPESTSDQSEPPSEGSDSASDESDSASDEPDDDFQSWLQQLRP